MYCMKCGREVEEGQVFCLECRKDMAKYPVRPGTVVLLPKREEAFTMKKTQPKRRTAPTPEEQIRSLKGKLWTVTVLLLVSLSLMAVLIYPMARELLNTRQHLRPGQNYSSVVETSGTP